MQIVLHELEMVMYTDFTTIKSQMQKKTYQMQYIKRMVDW